MASYILRVVLLILLSIGLYGALSVSYNTVTGISPCPNLIGVPVCYGVLIGYTLMLLAVLLMRVGAKTHLLFLFGWLPVLLFALLGTGLEIINGHTCPKSDAGLPLCYVSLTLALVVGLLFYQLRKWSDIKSH